MKRTLSAFVFIILSSNSNALFGDFTYASDGLTLVCLNVNKTITNRSTDVKYSSLWGLNTIQKFIVHINDSKVLISAYTPSSVDGDYYDFYGGVFDRVDETDSMPYLGFGVVRTNKDGIKTKIIGRLNRFTGDINVGSSYGPCKKIERLL
jgi:hypothetical protein